MESQSAPGFTDRERITRSETRLEALQSDVDEIKRDLKAVLRKFDEMSGGKKVLFGLITLLGAIIGIAIGIAGVWVQGH